MTSRGFKDFWRELLANIMSGKLKWFWTQNVAQTCNSLNAENWKSFAPDIFELYENIYLRRRGKKGGGGPILPLDWIGLIYYRMERTLPYFFE